MRVWLDVVGVLGFVAWLDVVPIPDDGDEVPPTAATANVESLRKDAERMRAQAERQVARRRDGELLDTVPREREMVEGAAFRRSGGPVADPYSRAGRRR